MRSLSPRVTHYQYSEWSLNIPVAPRPIDLDDRGRDPGRAAVIVGRLLRCGHGEMIVQYDAAALRDFRIKSRERFHGGLIHIPIDAKECELLNRGGGERVFEPALQKPDSIV